MKAALGEVNLTVIAIVAIGLVAAIAIPMVINSLNKVQEQSNCVTCGGTWENGLCVDPATGGTSTAINACMDNLE